MSCIACGNPRCNAAAQRGPCLGANANANGPSNRANAPFGNGPAPGAGGAGAGMGQGFGGHPQQPTFVSPRFLAQHAEDRDRQRRPLALAPLVTSGARFAMPPPRGATSLPASRTASRNTSPARSPTVLSPHHSHFTGPPPQSPHGLPHGNGGHGPHLTMNAKPHTPTYPLLTPSGHALSAGGRVRNISTDPASPCIMYWPDNEPLPERGQIRPLGSTVVQYPPIVNTGNKGAAEKQPGDWVCSKCNYLNWRRRKVCQTCYPYAEGNGDSISQAVQAERIALLTNLLNQTDTLALSRHASAPMHGQPASASATPRHTQPVPRHAASSVDLRRAYEHDWEVPDRRRAFDEERRNNFEGHRSGLDYDAPRRLAFDQEARPIYQTPLHSRGASPAGSRRSPTSAFLPSCLDDVISDPVSPYDTPLSFHDAYSARHSSSHGHGSGHGHSSPTTSTSSAELSFDEFPAYGYAARGGRPSFDSLYSASGASSRFDTDSTRFDLDSRRSYDSLRDDYARSAHHDSQQQRFAAPEDDVAFGTPEEDLRFRAPGGATRSGRRPSPRASTVWGEGSNYGVAGEGAFGVKAGEGALPEHTIAIQHPDQAWNLDGDESKTLLARAPIHADEVRELVGRFGRGLDLVTSA